MKKNKSVVLVLAALVLVQWGFDWGAPKKEAKPVAVSAPAKQVASGANIQFPQMMNALSENLKIWPSLSQENKKKAVEAAMMLFRERQNSAIMRPADFYVTQIDQGLSTNAQLQNADILSIVKMMAVMEYDFYNGQDKDALAKEVLGEQMYKTIRARRQ